jgi:hydrogenase maturation protease
MSWSADRDVGDGRSDTTVLDAPAVLPDGTGVLVIGYGNPLCGDDGIGPAVVHELRRTGVLPGARLEVRVQLAPEVAADASEAALLVLVDAAAGLAPGAVRATAVPPTAAGQALTHTVDGGSIAALSSALWGRLPEVVTVGIGPVSMEFGDGLSVTARNAIPGAIEAVIGVVARAAVRDA